MLPRGTAGTGISYLVKRAGGLLVTLAVCAAAAAPAANAGSNGQHIFVQGVQQWSVVVCGPNQNRQWTCTPRWPTPYYVTYINGDDLFHAPTTTPYWWVGGLTIFTYGRYGNYLGPKYCNVPRVLATDWWPCRVG
jgi:hypothetical protein